jgi:hypothetical protein
MGRKQKTEEASKRRMHPLELKVRVLQELRRCGAARRLPRVRAGADHGQPLGQAVAKGGYEALFARQPGPKQQEEKTDRRREAVLALKKAHPESGSRRIRDVLMRGRRSNPAAPTVIQSRTARCSPARVAFLGVWRERGGPWLVRARWDCRPGPPSAHGVGASWPATRDVDKPCRWRGV